MYDPNHRTPVRVKIEGPGWGGYVDIATKAPDQILGEFSNISACRKAGIVSAASQVLEKPDKALGFSFAFPLLRSFCPIKNRIWCKPEDEWHPRLSVSNR